VKTGIPVLAFLSLALLFSCKSSAQSSVQDVPPNNTLLVVPEAETWVNQNREPEEIAEIVEITGIDEEEIPSPSPDTYEEEIPEIEEALLQEEASLHPEAKELDAEEIAEENAPLPAAESTPSPITPPVVQPPIEQPPVTPPPVQQPPVIPLPPIQPPPVILPPPAQQPPVIPPITLPPVQQPPVMPPVEQPPIEQPPATLPSVEQPPAQQPSEPQPVERTEPRPPPSPPPFLGPAERPSETERRAAPQTPSAETKESVPDVRVTPQESTPPSREETFTPVIPELQSIPRDEKPGEQVVFSRVARLTVGQILEIPFRGTGWVYLGELGNRKGISYDSRRLDVVSGNILGQSFIFRAEIAGTYILKFYKQDFIQDYIINDYVQVIVGEAEDGTLSGRPFSVIDRGRVVAEPRWPTIPASAAEPAGSTSEAVPTETAPSAGKTTPAETAPQRPNDAAAPADVPKAGASPVTESVLSPEEYVRQAKQEFDAGRVEQALALLELLKQRYPSGTDEAWWLLGQLYESNSPIRDIKLSLEYYRRLVNEYPQSNRVDDARRRAAYLERYYLNIR
jgi:hypothetical protein